MKTFSLPIQSATVATMCSICVGCGVGFGGKYSNIPMEVSDNSAIAYQAGTETRPFSRLLLRGQYTVIGADAKMHLDHDQTIDVVQANDTLWRGPTTLHQDVKLQDAGFIIMGTPVKNDFMEFNIGGAYRTIQGELDLYSQGKQTTLELSKDSYSTFDMEISFRITPTLSWGGAIATSVFDTDEPQMLELNSYWTPIKNVRFNLGLFQFDFDHDPSFTNDYSAEDYQLMYRQIGRFNYEQLDDCDNGDCFIDQSNSSLNISTRGLKAGVTIIF